MHDIKQNKVKYYPIRRVLGGYNFEMNEGPIVSFLMLKFDLKLA